MNKEQNENEINDNNEKHNVNPKIKQEAIDALWDRLHYEVSFTTKTLGTQTSEFNNTIQASIEKLTEVLTDISNVADKIGKQNTEITHEFKTFALLPDKITNRIDGIVPKISAHVEEIHQPHMLEITERFARLKREITEDVANYQNKFKNITDQFLRDVEILAEYRNKRFFKNLAFTILFSALVSGGTSYTVATYFPRYVEIKGANNLSIYDSKVQVLGGKVASSTDGAPNK